ncbi:B12-binding domain-containing radical SAM protein [Candidatus Auribacterota bacterium]
MKIALIHFGNEESYGLLFVGGEFLLFDQEIHYFDGESDTIIKNIIAWKPDFIGFSPMTTFFPKSLNILNQVKKNLPSIISVFGGHHASSCSQIIDIHNIDIVVIGPIRGSIKKILTKEKGVIKTCPTAPDDLQMPARKEYYRDIPRMRNRYRKIMLSTLGCPWNCTYCSSSSAHLREIYEKNTHQQYFLSRRSIKTIIKEAKEILKLGKTEEIEWVDDDIFYGNDIETWLPEFVDTWKKEIGLPIYISTTSHYALKISDKILKSLHQFVNCIGMGVQAIQPKSLNLLNRSWDNEQKMKQAYDRLTSFGYRVNLQAIVGLPVDDPVEDALKTVKGLERIGPGSICSVYPLMIYPGTVMEKYCKDKKLALNPLCSGDTNSGIPNIVFPEQVTKKIRNICKLATFFVKYNINENWMRALIDIDFDEETSKALSILRYYECITDRLKAKGKELFNEIIQGMKLKF